MGTPPDAWRQAEVNADAIDDVAPLALSAASDAVKQFWPALDQYAATRLARIAAGAAWPHILAAITGAERKRAREKLLAELARRITTYGYGDHYADANGPLEDLRDDLQSLAGEISDPIGDGT
jgi:hypothetical protein